MRVDTTLPPVRYDEVPNFQDPPPMNDPVPVPQKKEAPKTETVKPSVTSAKSVITGDKPKSATQATTPATEKPKAKKVIIN